CSLPVAVSKALVSGDTVRAAAGSYTVDSPLDLKPGVSLRGAAAPAVSDITTPIGGSTCTVDLHNATMSDFTVRMTGGYAHGICSRGTSTLQRLHVEGTAPNQIGLLAYAVGTTSTTVIRDVSVYLTQANAVGIRTQGGATAALDGVTVASPAAGLKAFEQVVYDETTKATIRNSILDAPNGASITIQNLNDGQSTLDVDYSYYAKIERVYSPGIHILVGDRKLTERPKLVGGTNLHQLATSPSIDAGVATSATTDFEGDPRTLGTSVDIGADEFRAFPVATTGKAAAITATGATVPGTVDLQGLSGQWTVQYGLTTAYGKLTPAVAVAARPNATAVAGSLTGLTPGTLYHARVRATNRFLAFANGADVLFVTPGITAPQTYITAGPTGTTIQTAPTFRFASEAGATFKCRIDAGTWTSCTSPRTSPALTKGSHVFAVRATNTSGVTDLTPATRSFVVDATAGTTPVAP
ncbi:MAG TPA: choice-of-anchor Q domain-containing protein, partial [Solirubrobacteraceae bacterium]